MTDKYAVIGNPIAHSQSPMIHAAFAKQTHQAMCYEAILAPLDGFAETVNQLVAQGYKGVNVTVPFKIAAFKLSTQHQPSALPAEAANTLVFRGEQRIAENTDGIGLVTDIQKNLAITLQNKRVLLIGAGGAAQGVALEIASRMPALFVVTNRSMEKVSAMQHRLAAVTTHRLTPISLASFGQLDGQVFDVVINATSTGLSDSVLPIPDGIFTPSTLAYDMMYGRETPFMAQARLAGAKVADGLGMLVEQAAAAFYLWRDVKPDTAPVIQQMRGV
jgi:shikimate dehydrogenase